MWEPNEQLLIRVPVQYKKQDGSLFVTPRRVAFQQQGVPRLDPSIYYDTIYSLQQTPESSPKILFKIKTNPPESKAYTFQFTSHRALVEREGVKAQVSELYAKARGTSTSSLGTPAPFTPSGIASPSAPSTPVSHQPSPSSSSTTTATPAATPAATPQQPPPPLPQQQGLGKAPGNGNGAAANKPSPPMVVNPQQRQEFGMRQQLLSSNDTLKKLHRELVIVTKAVSEEEFWASSYIKRIRLKHNMDPAAKEGKQKGRSSRMVELNPGQQEGADVKYTLTSQMIHSIFSEYPSVKRAYDNNVPDRLTEQNFWKRFLASEFFHRSRTGTRSQMTAYDDIFDRCLEEENAEDARGPDLSLLENIKQTINLEASQGDHDLEGGNAPDFTMVPGRTQQILPLIRRFNRHSSRVLDTQPKSNKVKPTTPDTDAPSYEDEILLSDLTNDQPPEKTILDIQDTSLYFESQSKTGSIKQLDEKEAERIIAGFKRQFEGWQSDLTKVK
ncbi:hypothetical protein BC940DRAFT_12002 [Gongronella butleri]|nr:hypothetical protein BC940DRAFT_12002 [Gongronella butleri]